MSLSLGKKLIIGGCLLAVLPILVLGFFSYRAAYDGLVGQATSNAEVVAQRVADMTQLALEGEEALAKDLAAGNTTIAVAAKVAAGGIEANREAVRDLNEKLARTQKQIGENFEGIFVADEKGAIYADSIGGGYVGISIAEREYFKQALAGKTVMDNVVRSKKSGNTLVMVATPILSEGGATLGVMAISLKTDFLVKKISGFKVGKSGYAWMVAKDGYVISHPRADLVLKENIFKNPDMAAVSKVLFSGKSGVISYVFRGVEKTCGYAPVPITGWAVAFTQDDAEFLGTVHEIRNGVIIIALITLALAVLVVAFFARSITKPIMRVADGLGAASGQVSAAAEEVANASQSLAEGASQQAASIEETSASLEEITSMTRQNASNAQEANALTNQANVVVDEAVGIMGNLTSSMREISEASDETSKIIKTIDEIAFQTNLLALNAAVEAARAGEAGAGFAVVADEVRNLAMRAAGAAKSTQELIENTVQRVHAGEGLVSRADEAFKKVLASTGKVGELVAEIAAASGEQAQGVGQINTAVSEMDRVTQTVAASAEESAASSEEMNSQAESMHEFVEELLSVISGRSTGNVGGRGNARIVSQAGDWQRIAGAKQPKAKPKAPAALPKAAKPKAPAISASDSDFEDF